MKINLKVKDMFAVLYMYICL